MKSLQLRAGTGDLGLVRSTVPFLVAATLTLLCLSVLTAPSFAAASGDLAWLRIYGGPGNVPDQYLAAAPAPRGGVYVAGWTGANNGDFLVARYSAAGQRRWQRTYNGPANDEDIAHAAVSDSQGDLVVAGSVNDASIVVIKYGPGGQRRWARIYDDPVSSQENASDVAVDGTGNIYVLGWRIAAASYYDIVLVKYSPAGARRWVRHYTGAGMNADWPGGVALEGTGNIYVTGYSWGGSTYNDVITLKYDPAGHRRWAKRWDGPASHDDFGFAIAVSSTGTVYVAGQTAGISSGDDAVVLKYSSAGAFKWSRSQTSPGAFGDQYADIAPLGNGDVAATGTYWGTDTHLNDVLLTRLSPGGATRWVRHYDGPDSRDDYGYYVARGPAGAVFVTGNSYSLATDSDILTLKYSGAGSFRWARRSSGAGTYADSAFALLAGGGLYAAGSQRTAAGDDAILLKYVP